MTQIPAYSRCAIVPRSDDFHVAHHNMPVKGKLPPDKLHHNEEHSAQPTSGKRALPLRALFFSRLLRSGALVKMILKENGKRLCLRQVG
jgi:hypothetical protein